MSTYVVSKYAVLGLTRKMDLLRSQ